MQKVTIIDTGCANLTSVLFALKRLNVECQVSADEKIINNSDKLILPGVGTAVAAMKNLEKRNLPEILHNCKKPTLGICLGMQMLGVASEEAMSSATNNNLIKCLGIVHGNIRLMQVGDLPLPHMGWNQVYFKNDCPLFKGINAGSYFYFVHSYALEVTEDTIATCTYGTTFTAVVNKDNFFGTQFHPEKSGLVGAKLLQNFLNI
ncbi:MAG: imidazole glycerol phosphate synthase subunit HisH [Succinivibrionaceae bacterium]